MLGPQTGEALPLSVRVIFRKITLYNFRGDPGGFKSTLLTFASCLRCAHDAQHRLVFDLSTYALALSCNSSKTRLSAVPHWPPASLFQEYRLPSCRLAATACGQQKLVAFEHTCESGSDPEDPSTASKDPKFTT